MVAEQLPINETPETPPAIQEVSLEAMQDDPELYKNQLLLLVQNTPWNVSVAYTQGGQAESLVKFCLDTQNLEPATESLDKVLDDQLEDFELTKILGDINSAKVPDSFGRESIDLRAEKTLRKRLLAWADYLNSLINLTSKELGETA
jgi:hypothetical protein